MLAVAHITLQEHRKFHLSFFKSIVAGKNEFSNTSSSSFSLKIQYRTQLLHQELTTLDMLYKCDRVIFLSELLLYHHKNKLEPLTRNIILKYFQIVILNLKMLKNGRYTYQDLFLSLDLPPGKEKKSCAKTEYSEQQLLITNAGLVRNPTNCTGVYIYKHIVVT